MFLPYVTSNSTFLEKETWAELGGKTENEHLICGVLSARREQDYTSIEIRVEWSHYESSQQSILAALWGGAKSIKLKLESKRMKGMWLKLRPASAEVKSRGTLWIHCHPWTDLWQACYWYAPHVQSENHTFSLPVWNLCLHASQESHFTVSRFNYWQQEAMGGL